MTACLRFAPMIGARPGELSEEDARAVADHLATCDACQARLADEEALSGLLSEGLLAEANRRDFSSFSDEVLARIPAYTVHPERSGHGVAAESREERRGVAAESREERAGLFPGLRAWIRHHRAATIASALAPALAALALALYMERGPAPEDHALFEITLDRGAMVLETKDGPVVLLGDSDS